METAGFRTKVCAKVQLKSLDITAQTRSSAERLSGSESEDAGFRTKVCAKAQQKSFDIIAQTRSSAERLSGSELVEFAAK